MPAPPALAFASSLQRRPAVIHRVQPLLRGPLGSAEERARDRLILAAAAPLAAKSYRRARGES